MFWNWLNFTPGRYQGDPHKSAEWNRGAYIVEGAAHCGTCHTPEDLSRRRRKPACAHGAVLQGWFAPSLTNDPHKGIGQWTKDDIVQYLKTGVNMYAGIGPMAEAVTHSTSKMTDRISPPSPPI